MFSYFVPVPSYFDPYMTVDPTAAYRVSQAVVEWKSMMRVLWEQHIAWTRMTIISIVFSLPDVEEVTARLLRNATDMGHAIRPYYGPRVGDHYGALIREHLVIAADLVKAALAGHQKEVERIDRKWHANADEIARFWSRINLYIAQEPFRRMFYEHLALTKTEAVSMIKKNFKADIAVFDKIEQQALQMADTIAEAVIQQFPGMFR